MEDIGGGHREVSQSLGDWAEMLGDTSGREGHMDFLEENRDLLSLPLSSGLAVVGVTRAPWWLLRRLKPRQFCSRHG